MHRADALRTPSRLRTGYPTLLQWRGRYDFSRLRTSRLLPHTSMLVIECFLTRSMLFRKCIYTLFTVLFFTCTISESLFEVNHSFFHVSSDMLNFHCPFTMSMHVARLNILYYDTGVREKILQLQINLVTLFQRVDPSEAVRYIYSTAVKFLCVIEVRHF